jgi:hypothetical protein
MVTAAWFTWWINLSASSSVTSFLLSRPAEIRASWLLLEKFFRGFAKLLPSLAAALMMLLREGTVWLELFSGGDFSEGV